MTGTKSMLGQPAGWYQDPAPANPAAPETERMWDGSNWTGQVRTASKKQRQAWREQVTAARRAEARELYERAQAGDQSAQQELASALVDNSSRATTPDGQWLAGWWRRAWAYLIDSTLLSLVGTALAWHWVHEIYLAYSHFFDQTMQAMQAGTTPPTSASLASALAGPIMATAAVYLVVGFVYEVGFLKGYQATPGKMLLGLEVRLREMPGPLPWRALLLRWLSKGGVGLFEFLPLGRILVGFYVLFDDLWPLWDGKRQALHDKVARTNVVRRG